MKNETRKNMLKVTAIAASTLCAAAIAVALPSFNASADIAALDSVSISMAGAGVRMTGDYDEAIRFRASIPTSEYTSLTSNYSVEMGMLIIPKAELQGNLDLENNVEGVAIKQVVVGDSSTYVNGENTYYNVALYDIPATYYTQDILARAYITVSDGVNTETFYSEEQERNLAYVAYKESVSGNAHTTEETSALNNYMSGKTFYALSAAAGSGITLDYDYAYEGQVLDLTWDLDGKWMQSVSVNGDTNIFNWANGTVTMPAAETVVSAELSDQTDTPTVLGTGAGIKGWYNLSGSWKDLSTAGSVVNSGTVTDISDSDWAALKAAGYKGTIEKGKVGSVNVPTNSTAITFGVGFTDFDFAHYCESFAWADVGENYYISVWFKADSAQNLPIGKFCGYDFTNLKQGAASASPTPIGNENDWFTTSANTWHEFRFNPKALQSAKYWCEGSGGTEFAPGLYAYHKGGNTAAITYTFYSMELMLNDVETSTVADGADLSLKTINPLAHYTKVNGFDIYSGDTKLVAGEDYTADGYTVSGLAAGSYKVVYNLVSSNGYGGSVVAYPNGAKISRVLKVSKVYTSATVLDDMSTAGTVTEYDATANGGTDITETATYSQYTLTDEEYNALLSAGYKGSVTNRTASRVTMASAYSSRRDVYFNITSLAGNEVLETMVKEGGSNLYLSIWMRSNKGYYRASVASAIFGVESNIPVSAGWNSVTNVANEWFEVKITAQQLIDAWTFGKNNGKLTETEDYSIAVYIYNNAKGADYLDGEVFDIYSAEICVADKTATAGTATDVAISSTVFGAYTVEVWDANGNVVTEGVTVSGTSVTVTTAGTYTIVYKLTDSKFVSGTTVKAKLTVS